MEQLFLIFCFFCVCVCVCYFSRGFPQLELTDTFEIHGFDTRLLWWLHLCRSALCSVVESIRFNLIVSQQDTGVSGSICVSPPLCFFECTHAPFLTKLSNKLHRRQHSGHFQTSEKTSKMITWCEQLQVSSRAGSISQSQLKKIKNSLET